MRTAIRFLALAAAFAAAPVLAAKPAPHPGQEAFVRELLADPAAVAAGLDARTVTATLARATYRQSIIDAISRPAEKTKPWREYRPIFMQPARIAGGIAFYREHRELLEQIADDYGVPSELIVAIIGVETNYGRITGKYKVLDALVTLAFYYPPRQDFFRGELRQLFLLPGAQFPYALEDLQGSYAGAMGWGQFMPTSYARWARDHDGDGRIDLWNSMGDIFASIANYFVAHGWETGRPVAHPATRAPDARTVTPANYEPVYSVAQLAEWGYTAEAAPDPDLPATLIRLDGVAGDEYWITYRNFHAITRYNRSPLYSLAVHQLAQEIAAGAGIATDATDAP